MVRAALKIGTEIDCIGELRPVGIVVECGQVCSADIVPEFLNGAAGKDCRRWKDGEVDRCGGGFNRA